jgi:hypothetical protein
VPSEASIGAQARSQVPVADRGQWHTRESYSRCETGVQNGNQSEDASFSRGGPAPSIAVRADPSWCGSTVREPRRPGSEDVYDGAQLPSCGATVVMVNYRLGALGFLAPRCRGQFRGAGPCGGRIGLYSEEVPVIRGGVKGRVIRCFAGQVSSKESSGAGVDR